MCERDYTALVRLVRLCVEGEGERTKRGGGGEGGRESERERVHGGCQARKVCMQTEAEKERK